MLKLYFSEKNHINKIKISAKNLVDEDINSIEKFLSFYNKKKVIIFLKEDFDLNSNELRSSVFAKKLIITLQIVNYLKIKFMKKVLKYQMQG